MTAGHSPTVRRRRLASELRRLREAAGLTCEDVAGHLECSAAKVSRIETGRTGVNPRDVRDMLQLYGVEGDRQDALVELSRMARQKGWWHNYSDVLTGAFAGMEAEAASIRCYQAQLVPGLLQTEDYARSVFRAVRPKADTDDVERRVAARRARQSILERDQPPKLWMVIDEAVLHRKVGGDEVMREQLDYLVEMTAQPNIELQVLPFGVGAHAAADGPFVILGFPDPIDPTVVYLDTLTSGLYLEKPEEIRWYGTVFDHVRAAALGTEESVALIASRAKELS
ncbi:helix-turn-helix domain-containing protein [Allokutzneria sp. A3M-2-11 16]|uniref:helix-turn-helix domain-containing protein n=1 Tax=Allokutzneria sp. A3M-2-11 16 TaxID=2962043 RepID=UPI0020B84617|nr:helix-turn-helix transcriptional regulator [Allokutzneria sp. A3M-2-11 16]MCP3798093.1 helix-turn-helix domain-containing protein [Allokutzneria sp. A3M-2-11 16]